jgi:hypothetical protein
MSARLSPKLWGRSPISFPANLPESQFPQVWAYTPRPRADTPFLKGRCIKNKDFKIRRCVVKSQWDQNPIQRGSPKNNTDRQIS